MRRVVLTVLLVVCLAVAARAPRGLLQAAIAAAVGIARAAYAQPLDPTAGVSSSRNASRHVR